jgi:hypothetical protein
VRREGSGVVFNVWFPDDRGDEPTLFDRRKDAQEYADLWGNGNVEELTVMDQGVAAGFISEAAADLDAELEEPALGELKERLSKAVRGLMPETTERTLATPTRIQTRTVTETPWVDLDESGEASSRWRRGSGAK